MPSPLDALSDLADRVRGQGARVVFPEGAEPRVAEAAAFIAAEGLAVPLLLGGTAPGCETLPEPADLAPDPGLVAAVRARRPGLAEGAARRLLSRPACLAGALLAAGRAEAMVAGATMPTRRVIEAALMTVGPEREGEAPSSAFLMVMPGGGRLVFADCALTVSPDAAGLAAIARAAAATARRLAGEPRVALLSYATGASGTGPGVETVRAAAAILAEEDPDLPVEGPLQADAALDPAVARTKGATGAAAGRANVLVFPDLDAGNIGYKLVRHFGGALAVGPLLQGFARPVADLSRGASVEDIAATTIATLA